MAVKRPELDLMLLSGRIYCLLLHAYPAPFRRAYGQPMAQLFRDEARDAVRTGGWAGLIGLWFLTLFDLVKSALAEHIWEVFHMPIEKLHRWSGPAAAMAGLLWSSIPLILPNFNDNAFFIFPLVPTLLLMMVGLVGLYRRLPAGRRLGNAIAMGVTLIGFVLMLVGAISLGLELPGGELAWSAITAGYGSLVVGLGAMGLLAMAGRALGCWSFVPLALSAMFVATWTLGSDSTEDPVSTAVFILTGVGWILLGYTLWVMREEAPGPARPA